MTSSTGLEHPAVRRRVPLASLTTYKVGGPAAWYLEAPDREVLEVVLEGCPSDVPVLVLGKGSNVVVSDDGFPGLVVRLVGRFLAVETTPGGEVWAGAGASLPKVARTAAAAGLGGLEFLVGIPGTVGGAVRMNAGGHGVEIRDRLVTATVLELDTRSVEPRDAERLGLGYRTSALGDREVVLAATFGAEPRPRREVEERMRAITRWRREHQPGGTLNAGSVFKNPPGDAAGRIIDAAGLRGYRLGKVAVSELHANFIVAEPGATAAEIHRLVHRVRRVVAERTGIVLEPELRFVGPFEEVIP